MLPPERQLSGDRLILLEEWHATAPVYQLARLIMETNREIMEAAYCYCMPDGLVEDLLEFE